MYYPILFNVIYANTKFIISIYQILLKIQVWSKLNLFVRIQIFMVYSLFTYAVNLQLKSPILREVKCFVSGYTSNM